MTARTALLVASILGLTACGQAPDLLETVQTHDVNGNPITIKQVNCKVVPPCHTPLTPEQERAEIDYWTDYYTRHPEERDRPASGPVGTYTPPTYSAVAGTWGYPYRTYYQPYRGPIRIFGVLLVGPQGKGSRHRRH